MKKLNKIIKLYDITSGKDYVLFKVHLLDESLRGTLNMTIDGMIIASLSFPDYSVENNVLYINGTNISKDRVQVVMPLSKFKILQLALKNEITKEVL